MSVTRRTDASGVDTLMDLPAHGASQCDSCLLAPPPAARGRGPEGPALDPPPPAAAARRRGGVVAPAGGRASTLSGPRKTRRRGCVAVREGDQIEVLPAIGEVGTPAEGVARPSANSSRGAALDRHSKSGQGAIPLGRRRAAARETNSGSNLHRMCESTCKPGHRMPAQPHASSFARHIEGLRPVSPFRPRKRRSRRLESRGRNGETQGASTPRAPARQIHSTFASRSTSHLRERVHPSPSRLGTMRLVRSTDPPVRKVVRRRRAYSGSGSITSGSTPR
jgi:hypothetical protein